MICSIMTIMVSTKRIVLKIVKICSKMEVGIMQVNEYVNLH